MKRKKIQIAFFSLYCLASGFGVALAKESTSSKGLVKEEISLKSSSVKGPKSSAGFLAEPSTDKNMASLAGFSVVSEISVEDYLRQIEELNQGYKSSGEGYKGYEMQSKESELQFSPKFFVNLQSIKDKSKTLAPAFQGRQTNRDIASSGLSLLSAYGTESKIYYSQSKTSIIGADASLLQIPNYYNSGWNLELTQHLWQNGFGAKVRSQANYAKATSNASMYNNKYNEKNIIITAKAKFWSVAALTEAIELEQKAVTIASDTYNFLEEKLNRGLAEKVDFIQIKAYLASKKYDLENSKLMLEKQITDFNNYRGRFGEEKIEKINLPSTSYILALKIPELDYEREDIKAAKETMIASTENAKASEHNYKPTLDLVVTASSLGRAATQSQTMSEANNFDYPYVSVGLNFSTPINVPKVNDVTLGYKKIQSAAKASYLQSVANSQTALAQLVSTFNKTKDLLKITEELVNAQEEKIKEERRRYKIGKTDIYSLCLKEQDYIAAKTSLINLKQTTLTTYDQILSYQK